MFNTDFWIYLKRAFALSVILSSLILIGLFLYFKDAKAEEYTLSLEEDVRESISVNKNNKNEATGRVLIDSESIDPVEAHENDQLEKEDQIIKSEFVQKNTREKIKLREKVLEKIDRKLAPKLKKLAETKKELDVKIELQNKKENDQKDKEAFIELETRRLERLAQESENKGLVQEEKNIKIREIESNQKKIAIDLGFKTEALKKEEELLIQKETKANEIELSQIDISKKQEAIEALLSERENTYNEKEKTQTIKADELSNTELKIKEIQTKAEKKEKELSAIEINQNKMEASLKQKAEFLKITEAGQNIKESKQRSIETIQSDTSKKQAAAHMQLSEREKTASEKEKKQAIKVVELKAIEQKIKDANTSVKIKEKELSAIEINQNKMEASLKQKAEFLKITEAGQNIKESKQRSLETIQSDTSKKLANEEELLLKRSLVIKNKDEAQDRKAKELAASELKIKDMQAKTEIKEKELSTIEEAHKIKETFLETNLKEILTRSTSQEIQNTLLIKHEQELKLKLENQSKRDLSLLSKKQQIDGLSNTIIEMQTRLDNEDRRLEISAEKQSKMVSNLNHKKEELEYRESRQIENIQKQQKLDAYQANELEKLNSKQIKLDIHDSQIPRTIINQISFNTGKRTLNTTGDNGAPVVFNAGTNLLKYEHIIEDGDISETYGASVDYLLASSQSGPESAGMAKELFSGFYKYSMGYYTKYYGEVSFGQKYYFTTPSAKRAASLSTAFIPGVAIGLNTNLFHMNQDLKFGLKGPGNIADKTLNNEIKGSLEVSKPFYRSDIGWFSIFGLIEKTKTTYKDQSDKEDLYGFGIKLSY